MLHYLSAAQAPCAGHAYSLKLTATAITSCAVPMRRRRRRRRRWPWRHGGGGSPAGWCCGSSIRPHGKIPHAVLTTVAIVGSPLLILVSAFILLNLTCGPAAVLSTSIGQHLHGSTHMVNWNPFQLLHQAVRTTGASAGSSGPAGSQGNGLGLGCRPDLPGLGASEEHAEGGST